MFDWLWKVVFREKEKEEDKKETQAEEKEEEKSAPRSAAGSKAGKKRGAAAAASSSASKPTKKARGGRVPTAEEIKNEKDPWETQFLKLQLFVSKHGATQFLAETPGMEDTIEWLAEQERRYAATIHNERGRKLTQDQIQKLESINVLNKSSGSAAASKAKALKQAPKQQTLKLPPKQAKKGHQNRSSEDHWTEMYNRLCLFKDLYGHTAVPSKFEDHELVSWTRTQRIKMAKLQKGKGVRLTKEQISMLNDIDFAWKLQRGRPRKDGTPAQSKKKA